MSKRFVLIALFLHAILLFLPELWAPAWKATRNVRKPRPVKVRITTTPAKLAPTSAPTRPAGASRPTAATKDPGSPAPSPSPPRPSGPKIARYEDYLPGAAWHGGEGESETGDGAPGGGGGAMPPGLKAETDVFSGKLDVPLVFRAKTASAKAVAKIVRGSDGKYLFEYVDGEPVLRAVLFEAMRSKDGFAQLLRLMAQLETAELVVVLRQEVVQGGGFTGETFENYAIEGTKLTIAKTHVLGVPHGGISLPDAEAERAVARDAAHFERLKSSPAYQGPVRNREP